MAGTTRTVEARRPLTLCHPAKGVDGERIEAYFALEGTLLQVSFSVRTRELQPERVPESRLWDGNVVELFLCATASPGRMPWPYYEFEVSPFGQKCLVGVRGEGREKRDFAWDLRGFQHQASWRADGTGWDAEMKVPLSELGWDGDVRKLSLNAFAILGPRAADRRYYALNLPQQEVANFHVPERFLSLASLM